MERPRKFLITGAWGLVLCFVLGCSAASPNYMRGELANQGPLMLSRDNPFVAPNLFVALERDASPLVAKFIQHRGEPDAVEIRRGWFSPTRLYFFYFDKREAYLFEERESSWIIRGPERIPDTVFTRHFLMQDTAGSPALAQRRSGAGGDTRLEMDEYLNEPTQPDVVPGATPGFPSGLPPAHQPGIQQPGMQQPGAQMRGALPPEQDLGIAPERSTEPTVHSSGDVLHRVRFPGETLRIVAAWYTGSPENAGRIARINNIENPDLLYMGQEVRIPRYLLRTTAALPEGEVERYLRSVAH